MAIKMKYDTVFNFGKYKDKDKTVLSVAHDDPDYISWLVSKGIAKFQKGVMDRVRQSLKFNANCERISRLQACSPHADDYERYAEYL